MPVTSTTVRLGGDNRIRARPDETPQWVASLTGRNLRDFRVAEVGAGMHRIPARVDMATAAIMGSRIDSPRFGHGYSGIAERMRNSMVSAYPVAYGRKRRRGARSRYRTAPGRAVAKRPRPRHVSGRGSLRLRPFGRATPPNAVVVLSSRNSDRRTVLTADNTASGLPIPMIRAYLQHGSTAARQHGSTAARQHGSLTSSLSHFPPRIDSRRAHLRADNRSLRSLHGEAVGLPDRSRRHGACGASALRGLGIGRYVLW